MLFLQANICCSGSNCNRGMTETPPLIWKTCICKPQPQEYSTLTLWISIKSSHDLLTNWASNCLKSKMNTWRTNTILGRVLSVRDAEHISQCGSNILCSTSRCEEWCQSPSVPPPAALLTSHRGVNSLTLAACVCVARSKACTPITHAPFIWNYILDLEFFLLPSAFLLLHLRVFPVCVCVFCSSCGWVCVSAGLGGVSSRSPATH